MATAPDRTHTMAVFCDFENLAIGVREAKYDKFEMSRVLERLLLKGSIVVKKAYCDWERYKDFKKNMHEAAFELIEIPHVRQSGKMVNFLAPMLPRSRLTFGKVGTGASPAPAIRSGS